MEFLRYLPRRPSLLFMLMFMCSRAVDWHEMMKQQKAGSEWNGEEREKYCEKNSVRIQKKRN